MNKQMAFDNTLKDTPLVGAAAVRDIAPAA
jgi:hypothetical protein